MKHYIHRRAMLGLLASSVLAACKSASKQANQNPNSASSGLIVPADAERAASKSWVASAPLSNSTFQYGVASGDPHADSVVLWSHVQAVKPSEVEWELSLRDDFSQLVSSGRVATGAERDYTVKVIPTGLQAGTAYYYRFRFNGVVSPTGRTKTLPTGSVEQYGIALASCSNFAFGYFNAYDAIARDSSIDLVLHTGDYIYEYGAQGWGAETAKQLGRVHEPAHEIVSLADYRARHAQYKTDQGSLAMHATHPMVCCWDDHESANNPWVDGAQNHQPETEGAWSNRRSASVQAYYEWMPIRDPGSAESRLSFSRHYTIGDLANLVTLETRHTARAEQIDYLKYVDDIQSQFDADQFKKNVIGAPNRPMLSDETTNMVTQAFKATGDGTKPWHLLGNASPIAKMLVPDVMALGALEGEAPAQLESFAAQALMWKAKYNLPFYTDTWDGYPWARQQLYQACQSVGATDLLFLTGDSHSFWMNQLADDAGIKMGVELGTAGISSPGDFVESGWSATAAEKLDRVFESELEEVKWTDNFHQGYVRLNINKKQAVASFVAVSTVLTREYRSRVIKQAVIERASNTTQFV